MWAFGKISDGIESLDFHYFLETVEGNPPSMLNQDMVLKILSKNIYVDVKFTSWTSGSDGGDGGFSYIRSTNPFPSGVDLTDADTSPVMYPNPTSDIITIARTFKTGQASLKLFDVQGRMVMDRKVYDQESLGVDHLKNGIYFFHIQDEGETLRGKIVIK
jgi:hypothetical protein